MAKSTVLVELVRSGGKSRWPGKGVAFTIEELGRDLGDGLARELEITWRMLADNIFASFTPGLVLTIGVCLHQKLPVSQVVTLLGKTCLLCSLYTYIFDAANQAQGADEDKVNKPHRPVPAGLLTPAGAWRRFWAMMALYTATGWCFGVVEWSLMWQSSTITINVLCPPEQYFWCKTMCMALGVTSQLSQAWQLVTPIDSTGRQWIRFMALAYPAPLIFEDVRDMAGDSIIGRRTFALMLGERPIRVWFASFMAMMPIMVHCMLFRPALSPGWRLALCDVMVATVCWIAGIRSLVFRSVKADRITYQLFIFSYIVVLCCGCILWA